VQLSNPHLYLETFSKENKKSELSRKDTAQ